MMTTMNKVMIISVSAGSGHVRAAQALEETFKIIAPSVHVLNIDALNYSTKTFRKFISTHFLPPPVLLRYFQKKKIDIPVYCVVTERTVSRIRARSRRHHISLYWKRFEGKTG
ncbi:hypothetical protein JW926_05060 [Candidatus Sumerlaeota bacterium]|nr:hypothetical protein [Candidatus Sumerlaeota bacterium]